MCIVDRPRLPHVYEAPLADGAAEVARADQLVEAGLVDLQTNLNKN